MKRDRISFESISESFMDFVDSCARLSFFTRSKTLQNEKISECDHFIRSIKGYKAKAIEFGNEEMANEFFHMQCVVNGLRSVLLMWVTLKDEDFQKSWSHLIDAQEYTSVALKTKEYEGIINFQSQLLSIEKAVFPGWALFNSPGFIETVGNCSICGSNFAVCDHVENEIYFGSLCQRVDREVLELNHTAVVEHPRDKRCIVTEISDDEDYMVNYFTWERTGERKKKQEGAIRHIKSVLFTIPSLDFN